MASKISNKAAKQELQKRSEKINEDDLQQVSEKQAAIEQKFTSHGPLGRFVADAKIMLAMVSDYWNGSYREVPWSTIAAITAALLYVLTPIDLIPDFIPIIGLIDDVTVVAVCLSMLEADLQAYVRWKKCEK